MSAIAALKGYRTQFLYSLYYILKNQSNDSRYHLEGTEDLDVIDQQGITQIYIQVKNTTSPITLSDLITEKGTSFIRRYLEIGKKGIPVLISFGPLSSELTSWKKNTTVVSPKEKSLLQKCNINEQDWQKVKRNVVFELVNEEQLFIEICDLLKVFKQVDPIPTIENLLYWLSYVAEKQQVVTYQGLFEKIEQIAIYLSERIAIANRYGIYIKALHQTDLSLSSPELLQREYYYGTNTRYEHILTGQDVVREQFMREIKEGLEQNNIMIIHGASGQGKTSLAYRYAHNYAPEALIYEIIAQEDIAGINETIMALNAIVKKLNVPVLLIINVTPNSTYWLKIIETASIFKNLSFLIAIRNEDWFRAKSSNINFMYSEIELSLKEEEAALIYQELLKKVLKIKYSDFKEAWLDLGEDLPLMEFTYAITQGDSLVNRLQQQVLALKIEEQSNKTTGQIAILRMISLADYGGARIDVNKLKLLPGIQIIVEKFEREYLLKHTADKKYITGLHPIRSKLLCDLLFDEFLITRKDEVTHCLEIIEENDAFSFLLKCMYDKTITPKELIEIAKSKKQLTWIFYRATVKTLIWTGAKEYVTANKATFDEAHHIFGDLGILLLDVFHGTNLDVSAFLEKMDEEKKLHVSRLNQLLTTKENVFQYLQSFFQSVPVPHSIPVSTGDWLGVAETMFWLYQFQQSANKTIQISEENLKEAFEQLDVEVIAKVMLGLHFYSSDYDQIRLNLSPIFISKIRTKYLIPDIKIDDEVTVNYILDVSNETEAFSVHDHVLEVIDLLRNAFPDKKKFNTQAHGHRNLMIQLPFDDSKKSISSENLLLDEWANVNAMLRKLYEYSHRPTDWTDFLDRLQSWESVIKTLLHEFSEAFATLKRTNGEKLAKVMEQSNHDFGFEVKSPKSIADPFCLQIKMSKTQSNTFDLNKGATKENTLNERHQHFFKNYREFKMDIENFLKQSGKIVYQRLKNTQDPAFPFDSHLLHLSYVNLYNGIVHHKPFLFEKRRSFIDLLKFSSGDITEPELLNTATIWKGFNTAFPSNNFKNLTLKEKITDIKSDFEKAILKALRKLSKETDYPMHYRNNQQTDFTPVFVIDAPSSAEILMAVSLLYDALKDLINQPEYASLKQLVMVRYFANIFIVPLVSGRTFNHNCYKFPEYLFRDFAFNELKLHQLMTHQMSESLIKNLNIGSWIDVYSPMNDIYLLHAEYVKMRLLVEHLADLRHFDEIDGLDEYGHQLAIGHIEKIAEKLQPSFQHVLNRLTEILNFHEFNFLDTESETMYLEDLNNIKNNLFPTKKGDEVNYETKLTMDIIVKWADRLGNLNDNWGRFLLILQNKALQHYQNKVCE
ncbi:hypothetical protein QG516_20755 [Pedobacter gandavensis]|uniref:hypothetical protein n=1 Tax=Pedobacter gandavensis TaxID=2679963 RepID=UPI002479732A|nr:hypothetical protein [Pedobacter gandavensis]WGQ08946.1 hypothetical protein QG516_20755 [Pedobacter gandavensis]